MDFFRAKTVRIGKWRWPPPKEDGTPGTAEGFFEFKMRKMKEKGWPQIHSCNIVIFQYKKCFDIISNSDEICARFLAMPHIGLHFICRLWRIFHDFSYRPNPRLCREGEIRCRSKFSKYLKATVALQSCTWRTFPSCEVQYAILSVLLPEERSLLYRVYWS
jgi:hypothetical protein